MSNIGSLLTYECNLLPSIPLKKAMLPVNNNIIEYAEHIWSTFKQQVILPMLQKEGRISNVGNPQNELSS